MAKYYLNRQQTASGDVYDDYEAIADKSGTFRADDGTHTEEHSFYPSARVSVHKTAPSTRANWDFKKAPNSAVRKYYAKPAAIVDEEVGIPKLEDHLSGRLKNVYETTVYAADSIKNEKDILPSKHIRSYGLEYARGIRDLKKGTSELFSSTPGEATVTSAFSHTKMRHTVPIMAAMAHQQWGNLTASGDLSPHSSRMVRKAKENKLPIKTSSDNPTASVTNSYGFDDSSNIKWEHHGPYSNYKEIPESEVQSAKQHLKDLFSFTKPQPTAVEPKPKPMGPQFTQMQLPGMES